jgi:ubiquinone/menaquinone biosynthesis C-methylase UbiE
MPKGISQVRWVQMAAFTIVGLFAVGFVYSPIGVWTAAILSTWFIGTQKLWRGFLFMLAFTVVSHMSPIWHEARVSGMEYAGWTLLALLMKILPFLPYRMAIQSGQDFLATLSLPLWAVALQTLTRWWIPSAIFHGFSLVQTGTANGPFQQMTATLGTGATVFLIYWSAAVLNWMWGQDFRGRKVAASASIYAAACVAMLGYAFFLHLSHPLASPALPVHIGVSWASLAGGILVSLYCSIYANGPHQSWADKTKTVALLRSPQTGEPLHFTRNGKDEVLQSGTGEQFPIRNGIPVFSRTEEITGSNQKYHRMYEIIGGFYDDSQRLVTALLGIERDQVFLSYLRLLEVKPGDSALETSVGTGLNFKYLPRDVNLFGLDLSEAMLTSCQANLRRWGLDAELFLGNAEALPFADNSMDVVFHAGGINFFNDRAKAIREMIRVAKPGSRILIADETEEYVKSSYERNPVMRGKVKDRQEPVAAPVDLVPAETQELQVEMVWDGKVYALTFRKAFSMGKI